MAAVLFGAVLVDRVALSLRSLSIAMIIVVVLSPWSVLTPGFQMSFAATGALIATYEAWQSRRRKLGISGNKGIWFWVKSLTVTSLVSGLATMPFALYHFDRVAGFGLAANLMAMPIISLASAPLAAAALVLAPFGLSEWPLRLFGQTLEVVLWVAHTFDGLAPGGAGLGKSMPSYVLLLFTAVLVFGAVLTGWRKRFAAAVMFGSIGLTLWMLSSAAGAHWAPSGEVFLVDDHGDTERITLVNGDGLTPLRFIDEAVDAECSEAICWRTIADVRIALIPAGIAWKCSDVVGAGLVLAVEGTVSSCLDTRSVTWDAVEAVRGRSWKIRGTDIQDVERPPCGERPWAPCSVGSS